jgi:inner membrane protein
MNKMMVYTHLAFAYLCSLIAMEYLPPENKVQFITVAVTASVLTDIDQVTSWIGKRLEPLSVTIKLLFKHRGFFHSITAALVVYLLVYAISKELALAAFIGYASHIFLDALNPAGIMVLSPFSKCKLKGFIKVRSVTEHLLLLLTISGIIYLIF